MAPANPASDPTNVVWSLLGSSPIGGLLFWLLRGEQAERRAAVSKMLEIVQTDVATKAVLSDRMNGQDAALSKLMDSAKAIELRLAALSPGRPAS